MNDPRRCPSCSFTNSPTPNDSETQTHEGVAKDGEHRSESRSKRRSPDISGETIGQLKCLERSNSPAPW